MSLSTNYYSLRLELTRIEPLIWRRLLVPVTITLPKLHRAIQGAMGWTNSHLHLFHIGDELYGEPDPYGEMLLIDQKGIKLSSVLAGSVREFVYEYDFGDGWIHRVVVENLQEAHPAWSGSLCVAGQRACPPEDVGGIYGYGEFVDAIADSKREQHVDMLRWVGGAFDPEGFDINSANLRIRRLKG
ncbi:plasmid pRiA4b ORF-3 family protein [Collimonas pratensis]|nr:plasmid pRiA4b ORF-3 family protein [Collimonas pratensis]